jgi:hypothetical protein
LAALPGKNVASIPLAGNVKGHYYSALGGLPLAATAI